MARATRQSDQRLVRSVHLVAGRLGAWNRRRGRRSPHRNIRSF